MLVYIKRSVVRFRAWSWVKKIVGYYISEREFHISLHQPSAKREMIEDVGPNDASPCSLRIEMGMLQWLARVKSSKYTYKPHRRHWILFCNRPFVHNRRASKIIMTVSSPYLEINCKWKREKNQPWQRQYYHPRLCFMMTCNFVILLRFYECITIMTLLQFLHQVRNHVTSLFWKILNQFDLNSQCLYIK